MRKSLAAALLLLIFIATVTALAAAPDPVALPIGLSEAAAAKALSDAHVAVKKEKIPEGERWTYARGTDTVSLEVAPWPAAGSPASAWDKAARSKGAVTVTRVQIVGPNSDAKRRWVRTLERDGRIWALLPANAQTIRTPAEQKKYGMSAFLQWWVQSPEPGARSRVPSVTFLFQAERPANSPPGTEPTVLDALLENPYHPRRF